MNRDKVLELAREGCLVHEYQTKGEQHDLLNTLERFAALIERELVLDMLQRQPEINCHGDGNVYRGVRSKDSSKPTYVWPFIETTKGMEDGQE